MNQEQFFQLMNGPLADSSVQIPPESFEDMNIEVIEYEPEQSIKITAPLYSKYNNPAGTILGGYLPVFFDLAFGPLSFLVAKKPTTTLDLNTSYHRPITTDDEKVIVQAYVVNSSRSYLYMEAKAFNPAGKLVATSSSRLRILG